METGAATQPLTAAPAPRVPAGAAPRPMAPAPGGGSATGPMVAGNTANLPKATQKLQAAPTPARPAMAAPQSAPVKRSAAADSQQFYEEKDPEAGLMPLSVICFIASVVLMLLQICATDRVSGFTSKVGEDSPVMVPERVDPAWEKFNEEDHTYTSGFKAALPEIPQ